MNIRDVLPHMYYFYIFANTKSITKAAEELHISSTSIRYHINALEQKAGVRLIDRSSQARLTLTKEGEKIAKDCNRFFSFIDSAFSHLLCDQMAEHFNILAPVTFGTKVLMPCLETLSDSLSGIDLALHLTNELWSINEENIDIAITVQMFEGHYHSEQLMRVQYLAVASKNYIENSPPLNSLSDLKDHKLILWDEKGQEWQRVVEAYPECILPSGINELIYINDNLSILEAVKNDFGIALVPEYILSNQTINDYHLSLVLTDIFTNDATDIMNILYVSYPKLSIRNKLIASLISKLKIYLESIGKHVIYE